MAERSAASSAAHDVAPVASSPEKIRNVVLIGESGSGKTIIIEALLAATGAVSRAGTVEDGNTVSDFDEIEKRQQRSIGLSVASFSYGDLKINLMDAPGYADYVGELRSGLRAADGAVFVVSAIDGVGGATRQLWDECASVRMPRTVLITKLDSPHADFDRVVEECRAAFGQNVLPLMLPLYGDDDVVTGLMGLLTGNILDYTSGSRTPRDATAAEEGRLSRNRDSLVEAIITESDDELLLDTYVDGGSGTLDGTRLLADLETAVSRAQFFPVLPMAAPGGIGTDELLELIDRGFPPPTDACVPEMEDLAGNELPPPTADPSAPLVAQVVKTSSDPYVGRIALVRVFSGTLTADSTVHVASAVDPSHDGQERIGALFSPLGRTNRKVDSCQAGDLCMVAKLTSAGPGDTLSAPENPVRLRRWTLPESLLPIAIEAVTSADEEKLSTGLSRLTAEDLTLRLEHNEHTGQLVLWCLGESHADVAFERLREKFGVQVERVAYKVPLRETFAGKATVKGRFVKQSGGHGQYAICDITVEPLPQGSGFEFVDKVVGGSVPRQFIPSVEKGVRAQLEKGVAAGYPMVDIRVTLFDGKAHSVDSSDVAFQTAAALGLKEAASAAGVRLLEPVVTLSVLVDDEFVGAIMSDLSSRRGRVTGTDTIAGQRTMITAEVPEIELTRYAIDLRSMTRGAGTFTRTYLGHEPMPKALADAIITAD